MVCGLPEKAMAQAEEGTAFCRLCEAEAYGAEDVLDDGFGNQCDAICPRCEQRSMYIVRVGDFRCFLCDG